MTRDAMTAAAALAALLGAAGAAAAQYPAQQQYQQPYPYAGQSGPFYQQPTVMPNIYNQASQPLSPYLNLFRGSNPSVGYYYGVRPGTVGGTGLGIGVPGTTMGGNRPLFFPQLSMAPDPLQPLDPTQPPGKGNVLPPAGHPVVFNNTLGYFPSPFGPRGAARPALSGVGTTRPPGR